jgi:hypothetical protein
MTVLRRCAPVRGSSGFGAIKAEATPLRRLRAFLPEFPGGGKLPPWAQH